MGKNTVNVTIQKRQHVDGKISYRALILIQDQVIDGIGETPDEAEENLKMRMATMAMKTDKEFEKEVREVMKNNPKSEKNKIVEDAINKENNK